MEVPEFKHLLDIGLGRAILYLQNHDATPYRDIILNACLHNLALYTQAEGSRATYMLDVIELTGQKNFYRDQIISSLKAIQPDADYYDVEQLLDFAALFALQGDSEAHNLPYKYFSDHLSKDDVDYSSAYAILKCDKLRGFLFLAEQLGELVLAGNEPFVDDLFYELIKDAVGDESVALALKESNDPRIAAYMNAVEENKAKRIEHRNKQRQNLIGLNYAEVKALVSVSSRKMLSAWGEQASQSDLILAAHDLVAENNPVKLRQQMAIFYKAAFPLNLDSLFSLTHQEDEQTIRCAIRVLENISHPSVRAFALEMIDKSYLTGLMAGLLIKNYEDGDWQLMKRLSRRDLELQDYHDLTLNILEFYDLHPSSGSVEVFLTLYEKEPYANCRLKVIEYLQALNALPVWMIEECKYDSNSDIRELFRNPK